MYILRMFTLQGITALDPVVREVVCLDWVRLIHVLNTLPLRTVVKGHNNKT